MIETNIALMARYFVVLVSPRSEQETAQKLAVLFVDLSSDRSV
ncbi:hypothetical protein [Chelativorans sp. Marseille-P2723]|nr:hypothetical protein [Chelativorans sp. Marseille-P2723]